MERTMEIFIDKKDKQLADDLFEDAKKFDIPIQGELLTLLQGVKLGIRLSTQKGA